jgi:Rad52/22 family double-strand break repair protein
MRTAAVPVDETTDAVLVEQATSANGSVDQKKDLIDTEGRPTAAGWRRIGELLRKPMPTKERKGPGGRVLSYITARDVQNKLDGVVGPGNWSTSYQVLDMGKAIVQCRLEIFGVVREEIGYPNSVDAPEDEALKSSFSDALKRCAVTFGVGRWL